MSGGAPEILQSYDIVGKLGEGGMGAIYRVRHRLLEQERVVKILRPHLGGDADFRARFLREAQLVARLRHPNLALLHEFALAESGAGCIVMEFIEGLSLKAVLETSGPPSLGLTLEIARQGLEALGYLQRNGILHRDISTDNLMLSRDHDGAPLVKLIDLGIARRTGDAQQTRLTATGAFLGKVRYAAPEMFGGDSTAVDPRADLYSFGIVLYELLTGVLPIAGEDANSLIAGHLFQPPRPFAETDRLGRVPEALRVVVLRALAKRREDRFASAAEFQAALAAVRERWPAAELDDILSHTPPPPTGGGDDLSAALSTIPVRDAGQASTVVMPPTAVTAPAAAPTVLMPDAPRTRRRRRAAVTAAAVVALLALAAWATRSEWWPAKKAVPEPPAESADGTLRALLAGGKAFALVIGNGDGYRQLPRLPSVAGDVSAVAELLQGRYGFDVTRVTEATREQTLLALERMQRRVGEADRLLVYYAGHGGREEVVGAASPLSIGYWLPVDAGPPPSEQAINNSEISSYLDRGAMRARQVLVVADSCYAGTIHPEDLGPKASSASGEERRRELERLVTASARLALASGGNEPVVEPASGRSLFTDAFLKVLTENRAVLSSSDLYARLGPLVSAASQRQLGAAQRPTFGVIPRIGDDGGEFFFVPSDTISRQPGAAQ
jgi:serine/threonine-protein kinase